MRWELNDIARRLDKQPAAVELHEGRCPPRRAATPASPRTAAACLAAIDDLPEDEREAFDLVRIQGMSQAEAARVLEVSVKTVKRRLNRGLLLLTEALGDLYAGNKEPAAL